MHLVHSGAAVKLLTFSVFTFRASIHSTIRRDRKKEISPSSLFRLHPNPPSVPLYDSLANGQSESGPRIGSAVQPLKQAKDLFVVLRRNANTVVLDRD